MCPCLVGFKLLYCAALFIVVFGTFNSSDASRADGYSFIIFKSVSKYNTFLFEFANTSPFVSIFRGNFVYYPHKKVALCFVRVPQR